MKYTTDNLTDPMLKRLSAIVHGRKHNHGTSLQALLSRGLVLSVGVRYPRNYIATNAGREALIQARAEGW